MKREESVSYLANIYYLVSSDGSVDRIEERVFEQIAREIDAGYLERKRAKEMIGSSELPTQLPVRWSQRIRNLEDMLFAAYCNGVVDPAEKTVILEYAKQLGINQQQLQVIKQEAKQRYADFK